MQWPFLVLVFCLGLPNAWTAQSWHFFYKIYTMTDEPWRGQIPSDIPNTAKRVWLSNIGINSVSDQAFTGKFNLQNLTLDNNLIQVFPNFSDVGDTLTTLDLSKNMISVIPANLLQPLILLQTLKLRSNKLLECPPVYMLASTIELLVLDNNSLHSLQACNPSYMTFPKLTHLNLAHNNFVSFPPLKGLSSLIWINLDGNNITRVQNQPLEDAPNLFWVILWGNRISELYISDLVQTNSTKLPFYIGLKRNLIETFGCGTIEGRAQVSAIDLERNDITKELEDVDCIQQSIKYIFMSHNSIVSWNKAVGFPELIFFDLSYNNLAYFPQFLPVARSVASLDIRLQNNPLTELDLNVITPNASRVTINVKNTHITTLLEPAQLALVRVPFSFIICQLLHVSILNIYLIFIFRRY